MKHPRDARRAVPLPLAGDVKTKEEETNPTEVLRGTMPFTDVSLRANLACILATHDLSKKMFSCR